MHSSELSEKGKMHIRESKWQIVECPCCGVVHKRKHSCNNTSIHRWYLQRLYRLTMLWFGLASYFVLSGASVYGLSAGLHNYASGKSNSPLKRVFQLLCAEDGTADELRCFAVSIACTAILWTMLQGACVHLYRNCGNRVKINDLFITASPAIRKPYTLLIPHDQSLIHVRTIRVAHNVGLITGALIGFYIAAPYFAASLKKFIEEPAMSFMEMLVIFFFLWGWALISLPCAAIAEVAAVGIWRLMRKPKK